MRRAVDSRQYSVVSRRVTKGKGLKEGNVKADVKKQKTVSSIKVKLSNYCLLLTAYCLLLSAFCLPAFGQGQGTQAVPQPVTPSPISIQNIEATQAALVTEFDVNGLKVLVKRREGSQTVAAGLFLRGGSRNINAKNAGIESFMLSAATEASVAFPRERMRAELARMGTVIDSGVNYDYS